MCHRQQNNTTFNQGPTLLNSGSYYQQDIHQHFQYYQTKGQQNYLGYLAFPIHPPPNDPELLHINVVVQELQELAQHLHSEVDK